MRHPNAGLRPTKLASFYRSVGGNYNTLFLETPPPSLSIIYQALGCSHSLQPTSDDFAPPSIPTLTTQGFIRWQTIQLLLGPEEHVPYLQEAVRKFNIINPVTGQVFPPNLPASSFPAKPDEEMVQWHTSTLARLQQEAEEENQRLTTNAGLRTERGLLGSSPTISGQGSSFPHNGDSLRESGDDKSSKKLFSPPPATPFPQRQRQLPPADGSTSISSSNKTSTTARHRRRTYKYPAQYYTVPQPTYFPSLNNNRDVSTLAQGRLHRPGDPISDSESGTFSGSSSSGSDASNDDAPSVTRSSVRASADKSHDPNQREQNPSTRRSRNHHPYDSDSSYDSSASSNPSSSRSPQRHASSRTRRAQTPHPGVQSSVTKSYFDPRPQTHAVSGGKKKNYRGANVRWGENDLFVFTPHGGNSTPNTPDEMEHERERQRDRERRVARPLRGGRSFQQDGMDNVGGRREREAMSGHGRRNPDERAEGRHYR